MYKLCILAAGKGTRNTSVLGLHKALLPLENQAVISHIIKSVPEDTKIVIAVGYKSEQVKSYIKTIFPKRDIEFVYVENYDGLTSGPGLSLLQCKNHLQCPFIFTSADTIVEESFVFDKLQENWLGVSFVEEDESLKYCLVQGNKYLDTLYYGSGNKAFVGIAGIHDYKQFWQSLENNESTRDEYQVTHGFSGLDKIRLIDFTWYDTGNNKSYLETRKKFSNDVVAVKNEEAIFVEEGKVIKYYDDAKKTKQRIERTSHLNECIPTVTQINDNMFCYDYIEGELLSNILDENVLKDVLVFHKKTFHNRIYDKSKEFLNDCTDMYYIKTFNRIEHFADSDLDKIQYINGIKVKGIVDILNDVDWNSIYKNSIPTKFHGDFQPENIIHNGKDFKLIDWRESFGSNLEIGDFYYDLGKLYHAILINGQSVLNEEYEYHINDNNAFIQYNIKSNLLMLFDHLKMFCKENNFNWDNVELLGILQYVGICSLYKEFHKGKYGEFLFLLGKYLLTKKLSENIK